MAINAIQSNLHFPKTIQHQVNNHQQSQLGEIKKTGREDISQHAQKTALQVAHTIKVVVAAKADIAKQEVADAKAAAERDSNLASAIAVSLSLIGKQNADANLDIAEAQAANVEKNVAIP